MKKITFLLICFIILTAGNSKKSNEENQKAAAYSEKELIAEFETAASKNLLEKWYRAI